MGEIKPLAKGFVKITKKFYVDPESLFVPYLKKK